MRYTFLFLLFLLLSACATDDTDSQPSPEDVAFLNSWSQGSVIQIVGKETMGSTALFYFRGDIAANPEVGTPAFPEVQGVAFMEYDGQLWKRTYSQFGQPDIRINPHQFISHHLHDFTGQQGNALLLLEGNVFDRTITTIEIRMSNGQTLTITPIAEMYATLVSDGVGICTILALDANGILKQEITIPDNPNCR